MMKHLYISIIFLLIAWAMPAQDTFQLAPPRLKFTSVFFTKALSLEMAFAEPNTRIHYTLNGQEPTEKARVYTAPLRITKNLTILKARVFGEQYRPSDVVQATFIKDGLPIKSSESTKPNPKYQGSGPRALFDNQGGNTSISGNTWLGFQTDTVDITLHLNKKEKVQKVLVNLLQDQGSWIFLPQKIEAFAFNSKNKAFQLIDFQTINSVKKTEGSACFAAILATKSALKTDTIRVRLYLVNQLPDWHPGKGNKSWIFVDEIKVYD
jgi:hypothetical protein